MEEEKKTENKIINKMKDTGIMRMTAHQYEKKINELLEKIDMLEYRILLLNTQKGYEVTKLKDYEEKNEELTKKLMALMKFMKKLFSIALTGGNQGFLDENINTLIDNREEIEEKIKNSVIQILEEETEKDNKNNTYGNKNVSFSVSNN